MAEMHPAREGRWGLSGAYYGPPFTLAIFAAILAAISSAIPNRPCKLLSIPQRFELPVVYMDDLKSRLKSSLKSPV